LLVAPGHASAQRGVVTTPAVGDCHALTYAEGEKPTDPDPTVSCTDSHTSITVEVVQLTSPDWSNMTKIGQQIAKPCTRGWIDALGGEPKKVKLSAYSYFWFIPTEAERDAGATWVRCDAALLGGTKLLPLPAGTNIHLGSLPLSDNVARCRTGKSTDYRVVACSKRHTYHATLALKYPGSTYPGKRASARWALQHCRARMNGAFYWESVPSKLAWKLGLRYAVCMPKTRS
jgi:hypothetical protein